MDDRRLPVNEPTREDAETLLSHALFGTDESTYEQLAAPDLSSVGGARAHGTDDSAAPANKPAAPDDPSAYAEDAHNPGEPSEHAELAQDDFMPDPPDAQSDGLWCDDAECDAGGDGDSAAPSAMDEPFDAPPAPPQRRVESFVPTDAFYPVRPQRTRKRRRSRSFAWLLLVVLGVAVLIGGLYTYKVRYNPSSFFGAVTRPTSTPTAEPALTPAQAQADPAIAFTPAPTPTLDPYAALMAQADTSMMQNIVNILIIGVDYAEERETWGGKKEWHSDVMMVLAVNFDENRADLISLPRDTYAKIPGVKGIYKLNAAINCGGGMDAPNGAGFLKVCEAASWMLGGIPVDYYYAVTMPAVKGLVDAVGGVDYELEMSYAMMGRRYYKGQQHMDGQAVLDYLRVRKNVAKSGDVNRVNRQKRMMVALFESMQQQNLILKIPDLISSFDGQLFTNCTLSQTAALASFAYDLNKENIGMYSMTSKTGGNTNIFNWNFCLTDQPKRVQIIKTVYGIDVPEERAYSPAFARYRWADMRADRCASTAQKVCDYASDAIAHGTLDSSGFYPSGDGMIIDPSVPGDATFDDSFVTDDGWIIGPDAGAVGARATLVSERYLRALRLGVPLSGVLGYTTVDLDLYNSLKSMLDDLPDVRVRAASDTASYSAGERDSFPDSANSLINLVESIQDTATQLAANLGYGGSLSWGVRYEKDRDFNEVAVDFN